MNIPAAYTDENASPAIKSVYKEFQRVMHKLEEGSKTARGIVFDLYGNVYWEEPENEYLDRMEEAGYLVIR